MSLCAFRKVIYYLEILSSEKTNIRNVFENSISNNPVEKTAIESEICIKIFLTETSNSQFWEKGKSRDEFSLIR